jgi:hypothetical protein
MSTNDQDNVPLGKERSTQLSRLAQRLVEQIEAATPEDRAKLIADNRDRLTQLSLMIDGLRHNGLLLGRSRPDNPHKDS